MPVTVRFDPSVLSVQSQIIPDATETNDGVMTTTQVIKLDSLSPGTLGVNLAQYSNLTRPAPNDPVFADPLGMGFTVMIWNTSDKAPNFTDGENWYDADGNITAD